MLPLCIRAAIVTLLALIPTFLGVATLLLFNALDKGGPLVLILFVPSLGWSVAYIFRAIKKEKNTEQAPSQTEAADQPPKYLEVMSHPPPYDCVLLTSPSFEESSLSIISDKLRPVDEASDCVHQGKGYLSCRLQTQDETSDSRKITWGTERQPLLDEICKEAVMERNDMIAQDNDLELRSY